MARDGLRRQVTQDVGLRCPDANKEKRRDAVRSVAVWCWLRVGRVLALVVLATGSATCRRCRCGRSFGLVVFVARVAERLGVEIGACLAGHWIEERESLERGCIDFFAGDECRFARQTQRDLAGSALGISALKGNCDLYFSYDKLLATRVDSCTFDDDSGEHCVVSRRRYWPASLVFIALHLVDGETRSLVDIDWYTLQFDALYAEGVYTRRKFGCC